MAVSIQSKCQRASASRSAASAKVTRNVRVEAAYGAIERAQMTAASMAAALLLSAGPADAGVIMAQPKLQKAFQSDSSAVVKKTSSEPTTKGEPIQFPSFGLDPRSVGLPVSIGFVAGLAFVAKSTDSEFDDFMSATLIKDNTVGQSGLGYEEVIKNTYGGIYGEPIGMPKGTKKVKAAKKK